MSRSSFSSALCATSLGAATAGLTLAGLILLLLNLESPEGPDTYGYPGVFPIVPVAFASVGLLLALRVPGNPVGWLFGCVGLLASLALVGREYTSYGLFTRPGALPAIPVAAWINNWFWVPMVGLVSVFLLHLFPTGSELGPRWRTIATAGGVGIVVASVSLALTPAPLDEFPAVSNPLGIRGAGPALDLGFALGIAAMLAASVGGAASQVIRYRGAQDEERHQIKWFMAAATLVAIGFLLQPLTGFLPVKLVETAFFIAIASVPIAAGIAVLRYRLYDIDILINRTLVYVPLTGLLAGLYVALTGLLRTVFTDLTDTGSDAAIAFSTLAVVSLLTPLKNQLQAFVDRHFKESDDSTGEFRELVQRASAVIEIIDPAEFAQMLLACARTSLGARGGALFLTGVAGSEPFVEDAWTGERALSVPLTDGRVEVGELVLAPRSSGGPYTADEVQALQTAAGALARIIRLRLVEVREEPVALRSTPL